VNKGGGCGHRRARICLDGFRSLKRARRGGASWREAGTAAAGFCRQHHPRHPPPPSGNRLRPPRTTAHLREPLDPVVCWQAEYFSAPAVLGSATRNHLRHRERPRLSREGSLLPTTTKRGRTEGPDWSCRCPTTTHSLDVQVAVVVREVDGWVRPMIDRRQEGRAGGVR